MGWTIGEVVSCVYNLFFGGSSLNVDLNWLRMSHLLVFCFCRLPRRGDLQKISIGMALIFIPLHSGWDLGETTAANEREASKICRQGRNGDASRFDQTTLKSK